MIALWGTRLCKQSTAVRWHNRSPVHLISSLCGEPPKGIFSTMGSSYFFPPIYWNAKKQDLKLRMTASALGFLLCSSNDRLQKSGVSYDELRWAWEEGFCSVHCMSGNQRSPPHLIPLRQQLHLGLPWMPHQQEEWPRDENFIDYR